MPKGHIRQRASGSWVCIIPLPKDPLTGKRRARWISAATKTEAERLRRAALAELSAGRLKSPGAITLAEFFDQWIEGREEHWSPRTRQLYIREIEQHIKPALGALRIDELTVPVMEAYYRRALKSGRKDGGGLSATTVRLHHGILRGVMKQAVRWGHLDKDIGALAQPPSPNRSRGRALPTAEFQRLVNAARGTPLEIPVLLAGFGGLRRGEVLNLLWTDLDLDTGTLRVTVSKSESGIRALKLPPFVTRALIREKGQQAQNRLIAGRLWRGAGHVVCDGLGLPWKPASLSGRFSAFAARAGFPGLRFHDLRHQQATMLIMAGMPLKAVSARLGHSSPTVTQNIYAHALREVDDELAEYLEKRFGAVSDG